MNQDSHLIYESYQKTLKESWTDKSQPQEREVQSIPDGTKVKFELNGITPIEFIRKYTILSLKDLNGLFGKTATVQSLATNSDKGDKDSEFYNLKFDNGAVLLRVSGKHLTPIVTESSITTPTKYWIRFDHMSMANRAAMLLHGNHNYKFKKFSTYLIPDSPEDFEKIKSALDQANIEYTTPYHYGDTVMESKEVEYPSMFDLEHAIRHNQQKIKNQYELTPENRLEIFCNVLSAKTGIEPGKIDQLIFKSADYLHYHQNLDPDVKKWIKFLHKKTIQEGVLSKGSWKDNDEEPPRKHKKYIRCSDRMCGADDCPNCHPSHFRGGVYIDDIKEINESDEIHVPRDWEKKKRLSTPNQIAKRLGQRPERTHTLPLNVSRIVKKVEMHLGDVIEDPESPEATEECWTLCIDAANQLGRGCSQDSIISWAKQACKELGYPQPSKTKKIDPGAPGSAIEQQASLLPADELEVFISSGHDMDAVKEYRQKKKVKPISESTPGDFPSSSEMHGDIMVDSDKNTFEKLMAKIAALLGPENGSPAAQQSIMKGAPNKKVPPQHPPLEHEHRGPSYGS